MDDLSLSDIVTGDKVVTRPKLAAMIQRAGLIQGLSENERTRIMFKLMPMAGKRSIGDAHRAIRAEIYGGKA